jgi:hypothetical protein
MIGRSIRFGGIASPFAAAVLLELDIAGKFSFLSSSQRSESSIPAVDVPCLPLTEELEQLWTLQSWKKGVDQALMTIYGGQK